MLTGFPAVADISQVYLLVGNWCRRFYPLLTYKVLNIDETDVDEVHDELPGRDKDFSDIVLRAYAAPAEQSFPLTVFGIEELRDVILHASVPDLIAAGLATQDSATGKVTLLAKTGDRFLYTDGYVYDILLWKIGAVFGNTDIPTFYMASAEKLRFDALPYQGL